MKNPNPNKWSAKLQERMTKLVGLSQRFQFGCDDKHCQYTTKRSEHPTNNGCLCGKVDWEDDRDALHRLVFLIQYTQIEFNLL